MKKIICFVFLVCALIPVALLASGCFIWEAVNNMFDTNEYAWGKTFTYQGVLDARYRMNMFDYEPSPQSLLEIEFANNNLDLENIQIYGETIDQAKIKSTFNAKKGNYIADVEDLKRVIDAKVKAMMNTQCKNFSIKIGTEEEKTITISNGTKTTTYELLQGQMNKNGDDKIFIGDIYGFYLGNPNLGKAKYMGIISSVLPKSARSFPLDQKCLDVALETSEDDADYIYGDYLAPIIILTPTKTRVYSGGYYPTLDIDGNICSNIKIDFIPYLSIAE